MSVRSRPRRSCVRVTTSSCSTTCRPAIAERCLWARRSTRARMPIRMRWPACSTSERIEAILHCAARSLVGDRSPTRRGTTATTSPAGSRCSMRLAPRVDRLVFSSTAAVYGIPDGTPIPEDAPLKPINPYGESKRTFEGALAWYGRAYGLRSVTLRYFNVAGATETLGEDHDPETHLIPNVLRAAEGAAQSPSSVTTTRPPTARASATTSTSPTWPTPISRPSKRQPPATRGAPTRSSSTSGTAAASRSTRCSPPPKPSSDARSRRPSGRVARVIRRCWSRVPIGRQRSWTGARPARVSTGWWARPGLGDSSTRTAMGLKRAHGPPARPV